MAELITNYANDVAYLNDINSFLDISDALHSDHTRPVIVEFYSTKCRHCNNFKEIYESAAEKYSTDFDFFRVNLLTRVIDEDDEEGLKVKYPGMEEATKCGVKGLPTVFAFKGDQIICDGTQKAKVGYSKEDDFKLWLNEVRNEYTQQRPDYGSRYHKHRYKDR